MAANDLYVLPEDVKLIPVTELGEQARNKFSYDENDYVITYTHSRNASKVIDAGAASLLSEFRDPKSLVEGIFKYSVSNQLNPQETLDQSYLFLAQLRKEGYLIPFTSEHDGNYRELLHTGELFGDYEVIDKIQGLTDTEVYKVRDKEGRSFALKILLSGGKEGPPAIQFRNEISILEILDGKVNPRLVDQGTYKGHLYFIQEWCEGVPCQKASEQYHPADNPANLPGILDMTESILEAYAHLHAQGVIHSDIHPGNVLVAPNGVIKLIDFGLAREGNSSTGHNRGGMGFFYEPEYAEAVLSGKHLPLSSYEGEQYAIAALIYFLIIGKPYLEFSFEKETLFRQIAEDKPLAFAKFDLDLDAGLEQVLLRALSKRGEERYADIIAFAESFSRVKADVLEKKQIVMRASGTSGKSMRVQNSSWFPESLVRKLGWDGKFVAQGLQLSPAGSVNFGGAGIAYMFYRMACVREDSGLLALADVWSQHAMNAIKDPDTAFYSREIEIIPETVGRTSLYHTASGIHLVQSLISYSMGDRYALDAALKNFLGEMAGDCEHIDLTLGRSGMLLGCALLWENIPVSEFPQLAQDLQKTGDRLLDGIWGELNGYPCIGEQGPVAYYGIAHGWAGFLYATARWCKATGRTLPAAVENRAEQLWQGGITEGRQMRWSLTPAGDASWPGWCHGSAGYTFLWTLLYEMTRDEKFIITAEKCAHHFLADTSHYGSLCCGMSGEAYALLNLYRITSAPAWLKQAWRLTDRILKHIHEPSMRPNSLYKGDIGAGVLLTEIERPELAKMPLFE